MKREPNPDRGLHATAVGAGRVKDQFAAHQGRSERREWSEEVLFGVPET
mgnify:CR=1 FL=1|jgi:hypothetical protein